MHRGRGATCGIELLIRVLNKTSDVLWRGSLRGYLNGLSDEIIGDSGRLSLRHVGNKA